jgi:uncharacterized membrane protein YdbT with pleckstrin-like domain
VPSRKKEKEKPNLSEKKVNVRDKDGMLLFVVVCCCLLLMLLLLLLLLFDVVLLFAVVIYVTFAVVFVVVVVVVVIAIVVVVCFGLLLLLLLLFVAASMFLFSILIEGRIITIEQPLKSPVCFALIKRLKFLKVSQKRGLEAEKV